MVSSTSPPVPKRVDEYEIIRPLGSGAMGQVYRAFDTVLGRTVAVKFLASSAPSGMARERFLIEARAIARLHHPNVLAIYRVGLAAGQPYLVSEYVHGQSLDKVALPLPWQRVLQIALQLSRGLAAAHREGVLHRDLKPANVMLTDDGTAKLLDFGLAKLSDQLSASIDLFLRRSLPAVFGMTPPAAGLQPVSAEEISTSATAPALPASAAATTAHDDQSPPQAAVSSRSGTVPAARSTDKSLTVAGSIMGTPMYMAPEAWRGETATCQTDIYSLGAMLYELCCGVPPHNQEQLEDLALAAIDTDARPLAELAPGVDRRLAGLIDRCLRRDPGRRFATAKGLETALEALAAETAGPAPGSVPGQALRRRFLLAMTTGGLLLTLPLLTLYRPYLLRGEQRPAAAVVKDRRAVALVGLMPLPGSTQVPGLSSAFLELLGAELGVGEHFRRVPADSVARMRIELHLPAAASYSQKQLNDIRQHLGTDLVVTGSYQVAPAPANRLQTSLIVQDTKSGRVLATADVSGSPSELFALVARTGTELRQQLGIAELSAAQAAALRASKPTSHEVALQYAQGRERLRSFDAVGARPLLETVVRSDPDYPLGHLALADVWTALGYEEKARSEAKRAFELSANLPREDRYLIAARYRESQKEWDQAFSAYQTLLTFFPDSLDYGLYLGNAQLAAGQPQAAQATVKRLRTLPPPAGQDPHLDILEGRAAGDGGDQRAAVALLEAAAHKGESIGAPLLIARARLEAAYVLSNQGQMERALSLAAEAIPLFLGAGDRGGAADALMAQSLAYSYQGELSSALSCAEKAQGLLFEIENTALTAANLGNMALLLVQKGSLALAHSRAESGLLLAREIGLGETVGTGYLELGLIAMLQADLDGASRSFQQAETTYQKLAEPRMVAWAAWHTAQVLGLRGELLAARQKHEEALAVRVKHELVGFAAESRAALAALALEEQRPADAEALAREAVAHFVTEHQHDSEAWAQSLLAESLAAQHRLPAAQQAMARAQELAAACQNLLIRLPVQRKAIGFRLRQTPGLNLHDAQRQLGHLLAEATTAGMLLEQFELRLEQFRLAFSQPHGKALTDDAIEFCQEAKSHGLTLIEKKITAILSQHL